MRAALAAAAFFMAAAAAQTTYVPGVFVGTPRGPVELIAYSEIAPSGRMRMADRTSLDDVPTVETVQRILCSMPEWTPTRVWMASHEIFNDERAERRQLAVTHRQFNVYTVELRVPDLEDPEKVARLVKQVRGTGGEPAYVFVSMDNQLGVGRHYVVRLR
jgi:hypothetical protein